MFLCKILLSASWANAHANTANGAAANMLVSFFHVIAAFLRAENIHSIYTNTPFFAGNCFCRAGIGTDGAVTTNRNRVLRFLWEWAVCEQGAQANARTIFVVEKEGAFANGAKTAMTGHVLMGEPAVIVPAVFVDAL